MSTHSTVDSILGTATLGAFAIPEIGVFVAAAIGGAQALFDIFCPEQLDPGLVPNVKPTAAIVDDALWEKEISTMSAAMVSENSLFLFYWDQLAHVGLTSIVVTPSSPGAGDGGTFFEDNADSSLISTLSQYFGANTTNTYLAMSTAFGILENPGDKTSNRLATQRRRTENTELYCLIGSTWISYNKAWVIWDWAHNHIIERQRYDLWQKRSDQFKKGIGTDPGSWDVSVRPAPAIPNWNDYRNKGVPVKFLLKVIDQILLDAEGDGTTENPGLFTTLVKYYTLDWPQLIAGRLNKLSIQTDGTWWWYLDTDSSQGGTSPKVSTREMAEVHMRAKCGALTAYCWAQVTQAAGLDAYGLGGVTEDGLTAFGQVIEQWKKAKASVSFWTYTVQKGDTLRGIAGKFTPDPSLANPVLLYDSGLNDSLLYDKAIFDANRGAPSSTALSPGPHPGAPWQDVALTPGQVLMLPDREVVDFTTYTVTATDKYPHTICEKFFGDPLLRGPLDAANADIPNLGAVGTVIRIPKLKWAWYPAPLSAPTLEGWSRDQIDPTTKLPYYPHTEANGTVTTSTNWVAGFKVRYSVSFYTGASDTILEPMETRRGPWTDWLQSTGYFNPIFENFPWDTTNQATSRRIYRQFHDEDAPIEYVGEMAGNDPKAPLYWHDDKP